MSMSRVAQTGQYVLATQDIPHGAVGGKATTELYMQKGDSAQVTVYDPSKTTPYGIRRTGDLFAVTYVAGECIAPDPAKPFKAS